MYDEKSSFNTPSHLFHLKPIGIGTPCVESITSYIKRLAEAHSVTVWNLIDKEIIPEIKKPTRYTSMKWKINFNSVSSDKLKAVVSALEKKTCSNNLLYLTMASWKELFDGHYVFRKNHVWCPICYEECLRQNQPIYEQLIWSFKDVDICGKHQTKLMQKCPNCNSEVKIFSILSRVGFCSNCGFWLGLNEYENKEISPTNKEWQNWVYNNIGELVGLTPKLKETNNKQFNKNIAEIAKYNNISFESMASKIGVKRSTLYWWRNGKKPNLNSLLELSFKFGCSVYDILTKDINVCIWEVNKISRETVKKKFPIYEVKKFLDEAIKSKNGLSLYKVSKFFNIKENIIRKHLPRETVILKEKN